MSVGLCPVDPARALLSSSRCWRLLVAADARQPVARACQIITQNKAAPTSNPKEPIIVGNFGPPLNVSASPMSVIGVAATNIQNW